MASNYQHIVVAVDLFAETQPVLDRLERLRSDDTRVDLVHVVEPVYYVDATFGALPMDLQNKVYEEASAKMRTLGSQLGLADEYLQVLTGKASQQIVNFADQSGADLILLGSHGKHGLQLILGSTASGVLHTAKCDVLAARIFAA